MPITDSYTKVCLRPTLRRCQGYHFKNPHQREVEPMKNWFTMKRWDQIERSSNLMPKSSQRRDCCTRWKPNRHCTGIEDVTAQLHVDKENDFLRTVFKCWRNTWWVSFNFYDHNPRVLVGKTITFTKQVCSRWGPRDADRYQGAHALEIGNGGPRQTEVESFHEEQDRVGLEELDMGPYTFTRREVHVVV